KDRIYKAISTVTGGTPSDLTDDVPHGTHVLGIAGATTDNGTGVAGVTWQKVKMMPIKVGGAASVTMADTIAGLDYAEKNGANVVNMSLRWFTANDIPDLNDPFEAKIYAMAQKGIL